MIGLPENDNVDRRKLKIGNTAENSTSNNLHVGRKRGITGDKNEQPDNTDMQKYPSAHGWATL